MLGLKRQHADPPLAGEMIDHAAPEEWRVLRLLSLYRLILVAVLVVALKAGLATRLFDNLDPTRLSWVCVGYGAVALALLHLVMRQRPILETQAHLHLLGDLTGLSLMLYASGGVPTGLGTLVIIPVVGGALVLSPRMAMLQAALATIAMFFVEIARRYDRNFDTNDFTATGVLGLMLFGASIAANAVAQRARKSEALAEFVGNEFADLSRLNDSIVSGMNTGVLVVDSALRVRRSNEAAMRMLQLPAGALDRPLSRDAPALAARLLRWRSDGVASGAPIAASGGSAEVVPRFSWLGSGTLSPYVGVGVNYTRIWDVRLAVPTVGSLRLDQSSFGLAWQVGADYKLDDHWSASLDLKYVKIGSDIKLGATRVSHVNVDPVLVAVGAGYRF